MYRLAHNPCDNKLAVKLVNDQLVECIEAVFGPLNEDGYFKDTNRVKEFMVRSKYLKDLVEETYSSGNGLLAFKTTWVQIIKNRYEDILCKIKDLQHEYTFNEVGEGLIQLVFEFFSDSDYEYLMEYEDTAGKFNDFGMYLTILEQMDDNPELSEALTKAGRNVFDDVVLGCDCCDEEEESRLEQYKENPNLEEEDRKIFSEYYENIWYYYFSDVGNFGFQGFCRTNLFEVLSITQYSELAERWNDIIIQDVLFWDDDFSFVLPLLNDKKAMNQFIKICGDRLGYHISSADMAALSTDDTVYNVTQ